MADVHSVEIRRRNMSAIRSSNTAPELILRQALFRLGFRYRVHDRKLRGRPDLVLRRYRAVVFVHGCFFHGHECTAFRWPATRERFWRQKIDGNRRRDTETVRVLRSTGWRVLIVWECALRGRSKIGIEETARRSAVWLRSNKSIGLITESRGGMTAHQARRCRGHHPPSTRQTSRPGPQGG